MTTKPKSSLIISSDEVIQEAVQECLNEMKFRIILATNPNEARLKFSNEKFDIVIYDYEFAGLNPVEFVESIRHKEKMKNIKQVTPVLVITNQADAFTRDFSQIDHVKYLEFPFNSNDLKTKIQAYTGKSDAINNNTIQVKKDDYLIEEGGNSHEMYWVLSGKFVVNKMNDDNQKILIGEVIPGELVGEMSFLDNLPRSASVRAMEDSEVLVIPHKKFIDVLEGQPRWFRSLMQTLSQRLRNANKIIAGKEVALDPHESNNPNV